MKLHERKIENMVKAIDPANAQYIMEDERFKREVAAAKRFEEKGRSDIVSDILNKIKEFAEEFDEVNLTPANVMIGDGVTMRMYSDAHAGTVIRVTKTSVTVQQDKATLNPDWKPEIIPGGFVGHCNNQHEQNYTYERDENGEIVTFRWSDKYKKFRNGKRGTTLAKGRKEFYDYNF